MKLEQSYHSLKPSTLLSPVPARSSLSGFVHYSMREFFALTVSWIRGELPLPYPVRRLAHV